MFVCWGVDVLDLHFVSWLTLVLHVISSCDSFSLLLSLSSHFLPTSSIGLYFHMCICMLDSYPYPFPPAPSISTPNPHPFSFHQTKLQGKKTAHQTKLPGWVSLKPVSILPSPSPTLFPNSPPPLHSNPDQDQTSSHLYV